MPPDGGRTAVETDEVTVGRALGEPDELARTRRDMKSVFDPYSGDPSAFDTGGQNAGHAATAKAGVPAAAAASSRSITMPIADAAACANSLT